MKIKECAKCGETFILESTVSGSARTRCFECSPKRILEKDMPQRIYNCEGYLECLNLSSKSNGILDCIGCETIRIREFV